MGVVSIKAEMIAPTGAMIHLLPETVTALGDGVTPGARQASRPASLDG